MLDSTNRPKNLQRRSVRRRASQATMPPAKKARRDPGQSMRPEGRPHPESPRNSDMQADPRLQMRQPRPEGLSRPEQNSGSPRPVPNSGPRGNGSRPSSSQPNPSGRPPRRPSPRGRSAKKALMAMPLLKPGQQSRSNAQRGSEANRTATSKKRTSPLVYLCRLLILGVGVGQLPELPFQFQIQICGSRPSRTPRHRLQPNRLGPRLKRINPPVR